MNIINYRHEYKNKVLELLGKNKTENYGVLRKKIWDWQYFENPFNIGKEAGVLLLEEDERTLAGFTGIMPIRIKYEKDIIEGIWSIDAIIDEKHRGKGYGKYLVETVKKLKPIVMAFGISDVQAHIRRKGGFRVNDEIEEFFYCGRIVSCRDIIKKIMQLFCLLFWAKKRPRRKVYCATRDSFTNLPQNFGMLWDKVKHGYSKIVVRDEDYMFWKYLKCPVAKYGLITASKDDVLIAVGIFRKDKKNSRLVDYVGPANAFDVKYFIVKAFLNECEGSHLLSCICTDKELKKALKLLGFRAYRAKPRFYVFSNLPDENTPEKGWFIMQGDSDGDFDTFGYS